MRKSVFYNEINFLRALAVILVFLFHANLSSFKGGYIGVDIFYVVSGFLMTSILEQMIKTQQLSFSNFFIRRLKRLLPALYFTLIIIFLMSSILHLPSFREKTTDGIFAGLFFISNFYDWRTIDTSYFASTSSLNPLIHLWSVSLELQFYVAFIIFFLIFKAFTINFRFIVIILFSIISFVIGDYFSFTKSQAAFYTLPGRGWEMGIGAITYYVKTQYFSLKIQKYKNYLIFLLLIFIFFLANFFDEKTVLAGRNTALVALSTAFLIYIFDNKGIICNISKIKFLKHMGLVSYSFYLLHQPIFAFYRYVFEKPITFSILPILFIINFLLSIFSYTYVENYYRFKLKYNFRIISIQLATFTILILSIFIIGKNFFNLPNNINYESLGEKINLVGKGCKNKRIKDTNLIVCEFGDLSSKKNVILVGDSHALSLIHPMNEILLKKKFKGILLDSFQCQMIPEIFNSRTNKKFLNFNHNNKCVNSHKSFTKYIEKNAHAVIVISRWTFRMYPMKGYVEELLYISDEGKYEFEKYRQYSYLDRNENLANNPEIKDKLLRNYIQSMLNTKIKTYWIYPIPELGFDIAKKNYYTFLKNQKIDKDIEINYNRYLLRNKYVLSVFSSFEKNKYFNPIRMEEVFCISKISCFVQQDGIPYYYDDDHLSFEGGKKMLRKIDFLK